MGFTVVFDFCFRVFGRFNFSLSGIERIIGGESGRRGLKEVISSVLRYGFFLVLYSLFICVLIMKLVPSLEGRLALCVLTFVHLVKIIVTPC